MQGEQKYNIKAVSRITGLSDHVIRAWERRYKAVEPQRTDSNRRLYTGSDIEKLILLKKATDSGLNIGNIASLPLSRLKDMLEPKSAGASHSVKVNEPEKEQEVQIYSIEALKAVQNYSPGELDDILRKAHSNLGLFTFLDSVLIPLIKNIGSSWADGDLRIAQEHMASAIIMDFLHSVRTIYKISGDAPLLISATPAGEMHELGALIVSAVASLSNWRVLHLGSNLPWEEIISAAENSNAAIVCLSVVNLPPDEDTGKELKKISGSLGGNVSLLIGGRAAALYADTLQSSPVSFFDDIKQFREYLIAASEVQK